MALTKLNSSSMPTGSVLQVVQAQSAQTSINITSTTFTGVGLNADITTKKASSKFLVTLSGGGWYDAANSSQAMYITFQRKISSGSYTDVTNGNGNNFGLIRMSGDGGLWNIKPYSAQIIDEPSVSSGITLNYKVVARVNANSADFTSTDRGIPTIHVMEIAG